MSDDAIHPSSRVSVSCPYCGLHTSNPGVCDLCGKAIGLRPVSGSQYSVVGPKAIEWRSIAAGLAACFVVAAVLVVATSWVGYGKTAADTPRLQPVESARDLPDTVLRGHVDRFVSDSRDAGTTGEVAQQDEMSSQLRAELSSLNAQLLSRTQSGIVLASHSSAPASSPKTVVVPDGAAVPLVESPVPTLPSIHLQSVELLPAENSRFAASVTIANRSNRTVLEYDLTLLVGEDVVHLSLRPFQERLYPNSVVTFRCEGVLPMAATGSKTLVLRALQEGRAKPDSDSVSLGGR